MGLSPVLYLAKRGEESSYMEADFFSKPRNFPFSVKYFKCSDANCKLCTVRFCRDVNNLHLPRQNRTQVAARIVKRPKRSTSCSFFAIFTPTAYGV